GLSDGEVVAKVGAGAHVHGAALADSVEAVLEVGEGALLRAVGVAARVAGPHPDVLGVVDEHLALVAGHVERDDRDATGRDEQAGAESAGAGGELDWRDVAGRLLDLGGGDEHGTVPDLDL